MFETHSKSYLSQVWQYVKVDCDSSMLSMENITWGWRGVQQRMARRRGSGGQWLVGLVGQVIEGVMDGQVESDHTMGVVAITSGGSIRVWKPDRF